MVGIPFDSANSIWWKNKYAGGVGDKKKVGVVGGWSGGGNEEMVSYMRAQGGGGWVVVGMVAREVEYKRKSRGEKEKEAGSRDELKHPVPGWSRKPLGALI